MPLSYDTIYMSSESARCAFSTIVRTRHSPCDGDEDLHNQRSLFETGRLRRYHTMETKRRPGSEHATDRNHEGTRAVAPALGSSVR